MTPRLGASALLQACIPPSLRVFVVKKCFPERASKPLWLHLYLPSNIPPAAVVETLFNES